MLNLSSFFFCLLWTEIRPREPFLHLALSIENAANPQSTWQQCSQKRTDIKNWVTWKLASYVLTWIRKISSLLQHLFSSPLFTRIPKHGDLCRVREYFSMCSAMVSVMKCNGWDGAYNWISIDKILPPRPFQPSHAHAARVYSNAVGLAPSRSSVDKRLLTDGKAFFSFCCCPSFCFP